MIVEDLIERLAEYLYSGAKEFYYKGTRFEIEEFEFTMPITNKTFVRMTIKPPPYLSSDYYYAASYDTNCGAMADYNNRKTCSYKLASDFVTKYLPKLDYTLEKELYNRRIEDILSVLD